MKAILVLMLAVLVSSSCGGRNDNAHTTATTVVPPPPVQVLRVESRPGPRVAAKPDDPTRQVDPEKPLLMFNFAGGQTVREGEEVVIDFSLANVKLKGDGGEYRIRYILDDDEPRWLDRWEQVVLSGWFPGKHRIRLELIGPDGWPYRNGDYNVVTREFTVAK